jgi:Zn-dependent peptidase ImmA (M78 family)/DNA-binding transcriptional regulator YiaG
MDNATSENIFEPSVLRWARSESGMSEDVLAAKLTDYWKDVTPQLVKNWESGGDQPTFTQVKKLSEIYKRPVAVFFLDGPPVEKTSIPDRRTIGSRDNKIISPEGRLIIRKARKVQELAAGLYSELGLDHPFKYKKYAIGDDPAELAKRMRRDLSIEIAAQFKFRKYQDFFEYLRLKIEDIGVITLKSGGHSSFPVADARAFSLADAEPYVILVNNKDYEGAKNFSLLHEFAHILLREAGICNNFKRFGNGNGFDPFEVFCNEFAANFLVPREDLLAHRILNRRKTVSPEELDLIVKPLADSFKVSRFVILRRLRMLEYVTPQAYKEKAAAWDEEVLPPPSGGGRSVPSRAAVLTNGVAFGSLVVEAYKQKKLSYSGVSDYLGLKTKYIPEFEKILRSHGR